MHVSTFLLRGANALSDTVLDGAISSDKLQLTRESGDVGTGCVRGVDERNGEGERESWRQELFSGFCSEGLECSLFERMFTECFQRISGISLPFPSRIVPLREAVGVFGRFDENEGE